MGSTDDHTRLMRALLSAVTDLDELPHFRYAGRLLLAAAVEGKGCTDDAVARAALMSVVIVRDVLPSMLDRCLHVPALLTAKANRTLAGTLYTGIRLAGDAQRRVLLLENYVVRSERPPRLPYGCVAVVAIESSPDRL